MVLKFILKELMIAKDAKKGCKQKYQQAKSCEASSIATLQQQDKQQ